jgi:hypothetical protein
VRPRHVKGGHLSTRGRGIGLTEAAVEIDGGGRGGAGSDGGLTPAVGAAPNVELGFSGLRVKMAEKLQ